MIHPILAPALADALRDEHIRLAHGYRSTRSPLRARLAGLLGRREPKQVTPVRVGRPA